MSSPPQTATRWHEVDCPRSDWSRSGRPTAFHAIRGGLVLAGVAVAMVLDSAAGLLITGAVVLLAAFALPWLTDRWLERRAVRLPPSSRSEATAELTALPSHPVVRGLAPFAWLELQRGRLLLGLGDGRAAARAFEEAVRLLGTPRHPGLRSARAHALVVGNDPRGARELLGTVTSEARTARDHFDLGVIELQLGGSVDDALEHLHIAQDVFGDDPRVLAGLALAYARAGRSSDAAALIDDWDPSEDTLATELHKRATKACRKAGSTKAAPHGEARAGSRASARPPAPDRRKRRRDRRKERKQRQQRAAVKAATRSQTRVVDQGWSELLGADDEPLRPA